MSQQDQLQQEREALKNRAILRIIEHAGANIAVSYELVKRTADAFGLKVHQAIEKFERDPKFAAAFNRVMSETAKAMKISGPLAQMKPSEIVHLVKPVAIRMMSRRDKAVAGLKASAKAGVHVGKPIGLMSISMVGTPGSAVLEAVGRYAGISLMPGVPQTGLAPAGLGQAKAEKDAPQEAPLIPQAQQQVQQQAQQQVQQEQRATSGAAS